MNLLLNKFEKSDIGKLSSQVQQLTEERSEIKNDFLIKFQSFSQEIETLKSKIHSYEHDDTQKNAQDSDATQQIPSSVLAQNPALETSREYRTKYNLNDTTVMDVTADANQAATAGIGGYFASFFLTESELKGKPQRREK